ncbi:MAG: hypothetical protein J6I62_10820, partial [Selenomonadaceae bacterium]|nr:hypothetical protein [Selenomonadaceae bacterium]
FDDIKKVISIWICMGSPNVKDSGIAEYNFNEQTTIDSIKQDKSNYDLMQIVMVYIGKDPALIEDELLKLLHLVFRAKLNAAEKKDRLKTDYGIEMDNEALKEVNVMCNLGEGLVEETREEMREEMTLSHLKSLMEAMGISLEKAMDILKVPLNSRSMYASMIS